ncbi:hypothetical protein D9757_001114 [Collybiopsis confluens]|uniref:Uncharacterized protein n=1 Tax=Collybiopsis confluens TaxID=2823264 RepID=A0A8H5I0L2_9AGAR|nr:hypothetical protein D9757_001114 [Collybiopsis confluens]
MQFFAFAALVAFFSASSVTAIDRRIEVETLSVFCDTWESACAVQAGGTTNLAAFCEPGFQGNGTANVFCVSTINGVTTDYTQMVIDALNATRGSL